MAPDAEECPVLLSATANEVVDGPCMRSCGSRTSTDRYRRTTELVAAVGADAAEALARKVHADMTASTGRAYSVGISQVAAGPLDIPRLYDEARVALQAGLRLSGGGAVTSFAGFGLYRLISNVSEAELRAFVHDTLGPVLELPEPARADLIKSLAVLSSTRFNVAESARMLPSQVLPVPAGSAATRTLVVSAALPSPGGTVGCHRLSETVVIGGLLGEAVSA